MYNHTQKSELDGLEAALDFDLRKWWQPDAESYFGKLTIPQIGKAYEEAGLSARAGEIVKLKRRDAAKAAEQDLNAQGWLPDWMVRTSPAAEAEEATETGAHTTDHAAYTGGRRLRAAGTDMTMQYDLNQINKLTASDTGLSVSRARTRAALSAIP